MMALLPSPSPHPHPPKNCSIQDFFPALQPFYAEFHRRRFKEPPPLAVDKTAIRGLVARGNGAARSGNVDDGATSPSSSSSSAGRQQPQQPDHAITSGLLSRHGGAHVGMMKKKHGVGERNDLEEEGMRRGVQVEREKRRPKEENRREAPWGEEERRYHSGNRKKGKGDGMAGDRAQSKINYLPVSSRLQAKVNGGEETPVALTHFGSAFLGTASIIMAAQMEQGRGTPIGQSGAQLSLSSGGGKEVAKRNRTPQVIVKDTKVVIRGGHGMLGPKAVFRNGAARSKTVLSRCGGFSRQPRVLEENTKIAVAALASLSGPISASTTGMVGGTMGVSSDAATTRRSSNLVGSKMENQPSASRQTSDLQLIARGRSTQQQLQQQHQRQPHQQKHYHHQQQPPPQPQPQQQQQQQQQQQPPPTKQLHQQSILPPWPQRSPSWSGGPQGDASVGRGPCSLNLLRGVSSYSGLSMMNHESGDNNTITCTSYPLRNQQEGGGRNGGGEIGRICSGGSAPPFRLRHSISGVEGSTGLGVASMARHVSGSSNLPPPLRPPLSSSLLPTPPPAAAAVAVAAVAAVPQPQLPPGSKKEKPPVFDFLRQESRDA